MKLIKASFFCRALILWSLCITLSWAQDENVRVIEPDKEGSEARYAAIDSEKFELGAYIGMLSVEDFGSDVVSGIELSYHFTPAWMLQLNYGEASVDEAAFETSDRSFLTESDRDFEYYSLVAAYRLLRGRSFIGSRNKYDSDIYLLAGPERVRFAGDREWGLGFGVSYRLVLADWVIANVDIREHLVKRTFIGDRKQTMNTELRIGFSWLF